MEDLALAAVMPPGGGRFVRPCVTTSLNTGRSDTAVLYRPG
jgi:hypothetical protein